MNAILMDLIHDYRTLCLKFEVAVLRHVYREANTCADHLAGLTVGIQDSLLLFSSPPLSLRLRLD